MATSEEMDIAADEARQALVKLLKKTPKATAEDLIHFHQTWYMRAGHKRLGRLYVDTLSA